MSLPCVGAWTLPLGIYTSLSGLNVHGTELRTVSVALRGERHVVSGATQDGDKEALVFFTGREPGDAASFRKQFPQR